MDSIPLEFEVEARKEYDIQYNAGVIFGNSHQKKMSSTEISMVCGYWLRMAHDLREAHNYVVDIVMAYAFISTSNLTSMDNPATLSRRYKIGRDKSFGIHFDESVVVHSIPYWDPSRGGSEVNPNAPPPECCIVL